MAFVTNAIMPLVVRASSWDTQQRLPYNRNAPRKIKNPLKSLSLPTTSEVQNTPPTTLSYPPGGRHEAIDTDQLLKIDLPSPKQEDKLEDEMYLGYDRWLPSPPKVEKPRSMFNATSLAYVGDCIYELYARRHFLTPVLSIDEFNDRVMAVVRCEAQDSLLQKLVNDNFLTGEEREILRWGKNVTSTRTRTKKRAGAAVYNRASSLETLIGYLYLTDVKRLEEVMVRMGFSVGSSNQSIIDSVNGELLTTAKLKSHGRSPATVN